MIKHHEMTYDLTLAQYQFWLSQKILGASSFNNVTVAYLFPGDIDPDVFQRALRQLFAECNCLRLEIIDRNGSAVQRILPELDIPIDVIDFRNEPDPKAAFHALGREHARLPVDCDHLILKMALIYIHAKGAYWFLSANHILFDGWGCFLLYQRLKTIYAELAAGNATQSPPPPSVESLFAIDQAYRSSEAYQEDRDYWREKLAAASSSPKLYGSPTCGNESQSIRLEVDLPRELGPRACALLEDAQFAGRTQNIALSNIFMTAFYAYQYRVSGQRTSMVGVTFRNRHGELVNIPGLAVAVAPIQVTIDEQDTFRSLHKKILDESRETARHSRYMISNPKNRYFNTGMNFHNRPYGPDMDETEIWFFSEIETADLILNVLNPDLESGNFILGFDLNAVTFNEEQRRAIPAHYINVLRAFLENPDERIDHVSVLSADEKRRIIQELNPPLFHPSGRSFAEMFAAQAARTPAAVAVEADLTSLTYRQLDERSNRLAAYLAARGAAPQKTVGLYIDRSPDMAVGMLAILKSGATYVPLDPTYPADRLAYMAADADLSLLLTRSDMLAGLPAVDAARVCLDADWPEIAATPLNGNPVRPRPDDPAYITYTSGSTGRPKGVITPHASFTSYLEAERQYLQLKPGDRFLFFAALGFDASLEEILPAWLSGATVVLRSQRIPTLAEFNQAIQAQHITVLSLPAAYWGEWALDLETNRLSLPEHLRMVMVYAEEPNIQRFIRWLKVPGAAGIRWINTYGPTETAITASVYEPDPQDHPETWTRFPIGKPLPNHSIYILDDCGQPVAMGAPGEIYIGGDTALGYRNMPAETREKFFADPFWPGESRKMYRTGDYGRYLADGNIEFLGRIDEQVKLYGFRIELGEIESRLVSYPGIREVVALLKESEGGARRLVAYLTPSDSQPLSPDELRAHLKQTLPNYMIPADFIVLDRFPMTPNGKVDRQALPDASPTAGEKAKEYASTPTQAQIAAIWEEVLGLSSIDIDSNFFDLGGDSLLGVRMFAHMDHKMGVQVPIGELLRAPTIRKLAQHIEARPTATAPKSSTTVLIREGGPGIPLFLVHGWGGGIVDYYELARSIDARWPIYGLQAAGIDGSEPPDTTMQAMVSRYTRAIKAIQPEGPYRIAGYCQGGVIAYEMACAFEKQGDPVDFVGVIDVAAPKVARPIPPALSAARLSAIWNTLPFWLKDYRDLGWKGIRQRIRLKLRQLSHARSKGEDRYEMGDVILDNPTPLPPERMDVLLAGMQFIHTYQPGRFSGGVAVFTARFRTLTEAVSGPLDDSQGWKQLVDGAVKVHLIDSAHRNIHLPPYCYQLAAAVEEELRLLP